ncbi:LysR family transcriptional regulator [Salsuginibacillus halophilus]|uniref:LysR family transcriptional regulator n=1 Tax=Salsuginibacillus halophilus TaxID=517424 RepID=A0A2P8HYK2_9BACI|nr:LysR family transcriptional regulator [Salsuginibacillus halophilus]PSL51318.1 LysR family transcriptional regulator [Salsuginibacillus halophilus]
MNIKRLQTFVTAAEEQSLSKAANMLGLTQPAATKQIQALEKDLGTKLFQRQSFQLTTEGKRALTDAKSILEHWYTLTEHLHPSDKWRTPFRLGASSIPGTYLLPRVCRELQDNHPQLQLRIEVGSSEQMVDQLLEGELDVAVLGWRPESEVLHISPIWHERVACIAPPDTTTQEPFNFETLKTLPFVRRDEKSGTMKAASRGLNAWGGSVNELHTVAVVPSTEAAISFVEAGVGATFVSETAYYDNQDRNISLCGFLPERRTFYIATCQHKEKHPAAAELFHMQKRGELSPRVQLFRHNFS